MFNVDFFLASLPVMLKGMLGIFVVMGVILGATLVIGNVFKDKPED